MSSPLSDLQGKAFFALVIGALGDWFSTRLGLSLGLIEGNHIAQRLMSSGSWIQTDLLLVLICFTIPFIINKVFDEKAPKAMYLFPLIAGLLKLCVSVWNLTLILG